MPSEFAVRLVEACRRRAVAVVAAGVLGAVALGFYAAGHLGMDTDSSKLIAADLPWRQREAAIDKAFPQFTNLTVVVIDGATPDLADQAAARLSAKLRQDPKLFHTVHQPDAGPFFDHDGTLFLSKPEVQALADQLIKAQPMIGTLAADPSARGLFTALNLALEGVKRGDTTLATLDAPFAALADGIEGFLHGKARPLSWQALLTGQKPTSRQLRRFVLVQPVLDYTELEAGAKSSAAILADAKELGLTPDRGVRVRLTGPVPLADDEFETIAKGTTLSGIVSLLLVTAILMAALRSVRLVAAIGVTLLVGLVTTAAFAAATVGTLNPISIAFAVMFVGIAVDFGIQFAVRYRDERYRFPEPAEALRRTARTVAGPLSLAATTTAIGFLSFVPTDYVGVSQLGLIAGAGMLIALALNLTLLPALLALLRPRGEAEPVGFTRLAGLDRFLLDRRRGVIGVAVLVGIAGIALLPWLHFDFDPLHLKDPNSPSMATLNDLINDPDTTPYTIEILRPNPAAATALADRLGKLPEVSQVITASSFVPDDQQAKSAILQDAAMLMGPTLSPPEIAPPADAAALRRTLGETVSRLDALKLPANGPVSRLKTALGDALKRPDADLTRLGALLADGLPDELDLLRAVLSPAPVTLATLPASLKRDWIGPGGVTRVEVYPKGDMRDGKALDRFIAAVKAVAPDAGGTPVAVQDSGRTVVGAFVRAGATAVVAIALLLGLLLRRFRDVALVVGPLLFAGLMTIASCAVIGLPINFANIIALPLLLGLGVAFTIYFVTNWRAGHDRPLQSATARAILFSALTTGSAFGSLALSPHPGTASMGLLLAIALAYTLVTTMLVLPALLGPPPPKD